MPKEKFNRPLHKKDTGVAHIKIGEDPKTNLQKYGYCVVEGVFTNKECKNTIDSIWKWLEGLDTGIKKNNKKTWSNKNWPISTKQGMIQHTLGHEEFMWKIREHKNVIKVFEKIFNTNKLLTSFDGAMIGRPPETKYVQAPTTSWIHTDQDIIKNIKLKDVYQSSEYSIQGIATFEDCDDLDGSLFIGEKTHLMHNDLFKNNKKQPKGNWYMITKDDLAYLEKRKVKFVKVNAPKGSLILFDSRCFHSGYPSQKKRDEERFRYVIYVAMTPALRATKKDIEKKIKAIKEGRLTSHWSSNHVKLFGYPQTYGKVTPYVKRKKNIPDYKKWSTKRKQLAGLIKY